MNWVKKQKLPATEAIQYNSWPCVKLDDLWQSLHLLFNTAQNCQINTKLLEEISSKQRMIWKSFSKEEFKSFITKYNNSSIPGPDKLLWRYLKRIVKDVACLRKLIIADTCIKLGYWPLHFKVSTSIIISKSNKESYNSPKAFKPIILLNTIGKLIEKVIGKRLQFQLISKNFIYLCQLSSLKQCSTIDTVIALTYFIYMSWAKNTLTSTLAFNITYFFPSLNHQLLPHILNKARFDPKVSVFFCDYLISRKTKYLWNNFFSSFFNINIGVSQGLALSPILSALYLALILYILEKQLKNLKIPISILSFVDNGLLIAQNKLLIVSNSLLSCSYHIISSLLKQFGLIMKHGKTKVFHFSRSYGVFEPPSLNLTLLGGFVLWPKNIWQYLEFIFDKKLTF